MGAMIRAMRWRFDPLSLAWAVALFLILVLLATVGARWGWVRSFFGDVLAVVWVYFVFKTAIGARVLGSTADWWDVVAYVLGFFGVLVIERLRGIFRAARPPASAP